LNKVNPETIKLIKQSVNDLADESGWTFLGELGNYILRRRPDFDPRNFGFPKLLPLIKSIPVFEIDVRETGLQNIKHIYVRHK
jgi:Fe-S-cluster formation regulator IscX/YfhJ